MVISNDAAMSELWSAKRRAQNGLHWQGVFFGAAGAYAMAEVITWDQYNLLVATPDQKNDGT